MKGPAYCIQGVMKGNHEGVSFCCYLQWAIKGAELALTGESVKAASSRDWVSGQSPESGFGWLDEHDLQTQGVANGV